MHLVIVVLCGEADRSPLRSTVDKLYKLITSEIIDEGNHPLLRNVPWRFKVISLQWGTRNETSLGYRLRSLESSGELVLARRQTWSQRWRYWCCRYRGWCDARRVLVN
jgi:hypothetical protein